MSTEDMGGSGRSRGVPRQHDAFTGSETTFVSASPEETAAAGERLGRSLQAGDVVALTGELGSGKTCFIQGMARGLGVGARATSPTFVLINEYQGRLPVHHVDAYRTQTFTEVMELGLPELFDEDGVTLVEWADKVAPLLPPRTIHVHIAGVGDEPREITVRAGGEAPP
jgi:tRNA threonylcarbamoyladenosine biosynthesis protein TsaE